jgi:hypothetical protein
MSRTASIANAAFKENNDIKEEMAYLMVVIIVSERCTRENLNTNKGTMTIIRTVILMKLRLGRERDVYIDGVLTVVKAVFDSSMYMRP